MGDLRRTGEQTDGEHGGGSAPRAGQADAAEGGILSQLPRSRPDRRSARRAPRPVDAAKSARGARISGASARDLDAPRPAAGDEPPRPQGPAAAQMGAPKPRQRPHRQQRSGAAAGTAAGEGRPAGASVIGGAAKLDEEDVPVQGYEAQDELGREPLSPPAGVQLLESLVELAAQLARSSFLYCTRIAREALRHTPRL